MIWLVPSVGLIWMTLPLVSAATRISALFGSLRSVGTNDRLVMVGEPEGSELSIVAVPVGTSMCQIFESVMPVIWLFLSTAMSVILAVPGLVNGPMSTVASVRVSSRYSSLPLWA